MVTEYIIKESAIKAFRDALDGGYVIQNDAQATKIINEIAAEDVEPVVYCKDCRDSENCNGIYRCILWNIMNIPPNCFCAFGKRRRSNNG